MQRSLVGETWLTKQTTRDEIATGSLTSMQVPLEGGLNGGLFFHHIESSSPHFRLQGVCS